MEEDHEDYSLLDRHYSWAEKFAWGTVIFMVVYMAAQLLRWYFFLR